MHIRLSKFRVWSGIVVCAAVLGVTSLETVHATEKVDICHFQPGTGSWKLISVGQLAAGAHLEHHDDALPGETTSQTGTVLDTNCQEVTVVCPCGDAQMLNDQFEALTFEDAIGCVLNQAEGFIFFRRFDTADNAAPNLALGANLSGPPLGDPSCSYSLTDETGTVLHTVRVPSAQIKEINACIADVLALIDQVGCAP
jgi:hypothetical protein